MHQYTVSCLFKLHRINCKIKRWKLFDPFMDLHRSYTNVNETWDKGRIRKFMGVWELEIQIKFSIKYSVNSHINAALEQPNYPKNASESVSYLPEIRFRPGGFAPLVPLPGLCPGPTGGLAGPQTPACCVLPHCSGPSYAPDWHQRHIDHAYLPFTAYCDCRSVNCRPTFRPILVDCLTGGRLYVQQCNVDAFFCRKQVLDIL